MAQLSREPATIFDLRSTVDHANTRGVERINWDRFVRPLDHACRRTTSGESLAAVDDVDVTTAPSGSHCWGGRAQSGLANDAGGDPPLQPYPTGSVAMVYSEGWTRRVVAPAGKLVVGFFYGDEGWVEA